MIFARRMRLVAWLAMLVAAGPRIIAAGIIIMRVVPAATDRCVNQQRGGDQTGKNGTHKNLVWAGGKLSKALSQFGSRGGKTFVKATRLGSACTMDHASTGNPHIFGSLGRLVKPNLTRSVCL
jgi:hypothetical protein